MRGWVVLVVLGCFLIGGAAAAVRPWSVQIEWGDSIPAGTVYTVGIDDAGGLHAERKALPFTPEGLTVAKYDRKLPGNSVGSIRTAVERFIRQLDFDRVQGRMGGDGGFASVEIWDGSATLSARLGLLRSSEESGKEWNDLLAMVTRLLPQDFVK